MAASEDLIDSVANANNKFAGGVAEMGIHSLGLAMQNAVAHQAHMFSIQEAAVGMVIKKLVEVDVTEAVSMLKATTPGMDLSSTLAALQAAIASNQQGAKTAQTTPPQTGEGG